ncbi:MAG: hypothetical protein ACRCTI_15135 [Beijerinckiaceae bacterium]
MRPPTPEPALEAAPPFVAPPAEPHFSLLRLSAAQRAAGASAILVLLWLAVWWAL